MPDVTQPTSEALSDGEILSAEERDSLRAQATKHQTEWDTYDHDKEVADWRAAHLAKHDGDASDCECLEFPPMRKAGPTRMGLAPSRVLALLVTLDQALARCELAEARVEELEGRSEFHRERRDIFVDCLSDYERLRGYLSIRYNDNADNTAVAHWLADNGHGLMVEGVPEADAWRERFWPDPNNSDSQRLSDDDVDEMVTTEYEHALADGEPWAEEAFDYRQKLAAQPEPDTGGVE